MESPKTVYLFESPVGLPSQAARRQRDGNESRILQEDLRSVGYES